MMVRPNGVGDLQCGEQCVLVSMSPVSFLALYTVTQTWITFFGQLYGETLQSAWSCHMT